MAFADRAARHRQFALRMDELLSAGGREQDRKRQLLSEEADARVQLRDVDQRPRPETDVFVGFVIPAQRQFIGRAAGDPFPGAVPDLGLRLRLENRTATAAGRGTRSARAWPVTPAPITGAPAGKSLAKDYSATASPHRAVLLFRFNRVLIIALRTRKGAIP